MIFRLIIPDLLERIRKQSFLGVLAAALYMAYAVFNGNIHVQFSNFRGVYDAAWIGMMVGLTTALFVTLIGFYVVKNAVERDRETRVGEILAATPLGKFAYLLGKWLSNVAVLCVVVFVEAIAAVLFVIFKAEVPGFEWWPLLSPFILIAIPAISFAAALAVFFECMPVLRSGWGNAAYFFLWTALLASPITEKSSTFDWCGIATVARYTEPAIKKFDSSYDQGFAFNAGPREDNQKLKAVAIPAIPWNAQMVASRMFWFLLSIALIFFASLFFDRFDKSRDFVLRGKTGEAVISADASPDRVAAQPKRKLSERLAAISPAGLLGVVRSNSRFGTMLLAELRLMLKGVNIWMAAISLGLIVACLASPLDAVREYLLPVAWLVPLLAWSSMGLREKKYGVEQIVFSSPDIMRVQLPAMWLAGVLVALLAGSGAIIHYCIAGDWATLGGTLTGAVFIPALALGLGIWSGTPRFFEALYVALWYIGPLNQVPSFDFTGATLVGVHTGVPLIFLLFTGSLLALAFVGRKRQMQL